MSHLYPYPTEADAVEAIGLVFAHLTGQTQGYPHLAHAGWVGTGYGLQIAYSDAMLAKGDPSAVLARGNADEGRALILAHGKRGPGGIDVGKWSALDWINVVAFLAKLFVLGPGGL